MHLMRNIVMKRRAVALLGAGVLTLAACGSGTDGGASDGGGEAIQAMLNGSAEASTGGFADMYPQVESGRLRALGIAAKERLDGVDVPTMTEQGFDVTLTNWRAVFAPPIADEDQLADFRALIEETTATKEWKAAVKRNYWVEFPATGQELQDFIDAERTKIGRLIKEMTS